MGSDLEGQDLREANPEQVARNCVNNPVNKHCRLDQRTAHQHSAQRPQAARERIEERQEGGEMKRKQRWEVVLIILFSNYSMAQRADAICFDVYNSAKDVPKAQRGNCSHRDTVAAPVAAAVVQRGGAECPSICPGAPVTRGELLLLPSTLLVFPLRLQNAV